MLAMARSFFFLFITTAFPFTSASLCCLAQTPVIQLWPDGAPGFEDRKDEPEVAKDWWVANIHNPSLTAFLPERGNANGTGIVICPGGGHRQLVFDAEGTDTAKFLSELGYACFVLKYRLGREENSPYKIDVHALADGQRAIRVIRSRAEELGIDPKRIGMFGFSAGGEVVSMVAYATGEGNLDSKDSVEQASAELNFQIQVYPGPLGIPEVLPKKLPPAFLLVAADDGASKNIVRLINGYSSQGAPFEAHIYERGGHGFNMGQRSKLASVGSWPQRLADWLSDNIVSTAPSPP
jgi:acetyl esterase/lipase